MFYFTFTVELRHFYERNFHTKLPYVTKGNGTSEAEQKVYLSSGRGKRKGAKILERNAATTVNAFSKAICFRNPQEDGLGF